jgi:hypothetical protein
MVILTVGLNTIRDLHSATIDKGWLGTDSTAVSESQTGLQAGVAASKLAVTITAEDKTNVVEYTLPSATAAGNTFREFAAIDDGTVEYSRDVFTGIEHTANDDIVVRKTFFYRNP